ncbi:MAG: glycosyltransferase family 9 protein [Nitrospinota bacterium]|nr:glycosyltransferase family 9 protein [Nitrospinota bacterium]
MNINKESVKRILVLRYRSIGDIVLCYPVLENLKLTFPNATIDIVVDDVFKDLCYGWPMINEVICNRRKRKGIGKFESAMEDIKFNWSILRRRYNLVVDLHCGPRSALLTLFSLARYRLGNRHRLRNSICYNIFPPPGDKPHSVENMLSMLAPLEPHIEESKRLFLSASDTDMEYIRSFLSKLGISDSDRLVMVHPGARVDFKRLPPEVMGEAIAWMRQKYGVKVILAGSDADLTALSDIAKAAGHKCKVATNLSIGQLSALINSCVLFIGNDSGPMHMAAALNVPVIAFFGPSDPAIWGPWKVRSKIVQAPAMECMPCDQKGCKFVPEHCMTKIKTENVKRAISGMLDEKSARIAAS